LFPTFYPVSTSFLDRQQLKKQSTKAQQEQGLFYLIEETLGGLKSGSKATTQKLILTEFFKNLRSFFFLLSNSIGNRQNLVSPMNSWASW
jgi:subfamily B ATP-binding cassette protein MsbA